MSTPVSSRLVSVDADGNELASWSTSTGIVLSGSVTFDRKREVRRTCQLELANPTGALSPFAFGDAFFTDSRIRLERSAADGSSMVRLGTYRVASFQVTMLGKLIVAGEDLLSFCQQPLGEAVVLDASMTGADAVRQLLEPVLGDGSDWDLDDGGQTLGVAQSFPEDADRLSSAVTLATNLGCELYADRDDGFPTMRPEPDPTTLPTSATYEQVVGVAEMIDLQRSGQSRAYNRSVVIGTDDSNLPIRGQADVTDSSSAVHSSRIGLRVAPLYRSAQITTQSQADAVALARLYQLALVQDAVGGSAIPDPDRSEGDVVAFVEPISGTNDRYWLQTVTHPIGMGTMQLAGPRAIALFAGDDR